MVYKGRENDQEKYGFNNIIMEVNFSIGVVECNELDKIKPFDNGNISLDKLYLVSLKLSPVTFPFLFKYTFTFLILKCF